jgi:hypothetical protein
MHKILLRYRWLAVWLAAAALLVKVLVPTGFMPAVVDGVMVIELCTGEGLKSVAVATPTESKHTGGNDMPCAFAGLSAPMMGAIDPALLALAILFMLAAGLHTPQHTPHTATLRLRPPLRGPPDLRVRS